MDSELISGEHAENSDKPRGKLRRSCEGCRNFKIRCTPSEREGEACQRRVDEMEQKVESLMAMITSGARTGATTSRESSLSELGTSIVRSDGFAVSRCSTLPQFQFSNKVSKASQPFGNHPFPIPPTPSFTIFDDLQDVISRGIFTVEKAENCLRQFASKAYNFPFVVISPESSLDLLRRQKPFTLLVILAVSSLDNMKLLNLLDQEIRDTLGRRVFMSGEKSLDLVQGILAYLNWHHYFFEPQHQQIYQLCQIAVSMAIDLNITTSEHNKRNGPSSSFNLLSVIAEDNCKLTSSHDAEAKRAFLGCYYISSTLCIGLRKPTNIKYTSYFEECCQALATKCELKSDAFIPYFIQLQKLADDVNQIFNYDGHQEAPPLEPGSVELLVKSFRQQLVQLENSFPAEFWKHDMLVMAYYHLRTFVNEVGFHEIALPPIHLMSDQSSYPDWCSSITRSEVLVSCLDGAKNYIDRFVSLSPDVLLTASFSDLAKLIYNVLIIRLFATWVKEDELSLDATNTQMSANMAFYMQVLAQKFDNMNKVALLRGLHDGSVPEDYTLYLAQLFRTYEARARDGMQARQFPATNYPDMSLMQVILPHPQELLPSLLSTELNSTITLPAQDDSEEQWGDMLDGWSPTLDPRDLSTGSLFT
ncbi:hypothetical protein BGZ60DRAFT_371863 [Tricladium varicosporioides]|nr:hypothetical protein BGZ60DRAFT_371863 [Hymenoscyphus varicosporioides]